MIFERAARREFTQAAAGISIALMAILLSMQLIRLLKDAAGGRLAPEGVIAMLGFAAIKFLPMLLILTLFIAVLLVLSRMYRDSEMVVWLSCGMPLTHWLRPVFRFSLPIIIAVGVLSLELGAWANRVQAEYQSSLAARSELSSVVSGTFKEVRQGRQVYFVEKVDGDAQRVGNVFVASMQDGQLGVVVSSAGYLQAGEDGEQFIVMERGRRYEIEPGQASFRVMEFADYRVRTEITGGDAIRDTPKNLSFVDLLFSQQRAARGELLFRISMPVAALILAFAAIPLAYGNPRAGRSANLLIAVLVFAIYSNLITVSQSWVSRGTLPFAVGVWLPHLLVLLPVLLLFWYRASLGRPLTFRKSA